MADLVIRKERFWRIACSYDNQMPWTQVHIQGAKRIHILHKLPQMVEKEGKVPAVFNVVSAPLIPNLDDDRVQQEGGRSVSMMNIDANIPD